MTPRVIGLDLSLTATGVATPDRTFTTGGKLPKDAPDMLRCERIAAIRDVVLRECGTARNWATGEDYPSPLVVMEGFSFGSPQGATEAGGLGWAVRVALHEAGIPFAVVPPTTLKKYACGKGTADKTEMVIAARERLGYDGHDNNVADALWLQAMGLERLGCPVVDLPAVHRAALDRVAWPEGVT